MNTNWLDGMLVLLYSLKTHTKLLDNDKIDFKIYYNELSKDAKNKISKLYPKTIFEKPLTKVNGTNTLYGTENQDVWLCIESFREFNYDKVLCLDADMMITNDISDIFEIKGDFICVDNKKYIENNIIEVFGNKTSINGGLWLINKKYLSLKIYNNIINLSKKIYKDAYAEQSAIQKYFNDKKIIILPILWNFMEWGGGYRFQEPTTELYLNNKDKIKIIHFSGPRKPWSKHQQKKKTDRIGARNLEKLQQSDPYKIWKKMYNQI